MSNRSSHFVHRFQTLPSFLAGGPRRLPALAAVLALLALALLPTAAQAQTAQAQTELWSDTMTVGSLTFGGVTFLGWNDDGHYTGSGLTDEDFDYGDHTYNFKSISLTSGSLLLVFNDTGAGDLATKATRDKLTLHVGGTTFNLGNGDLNNFSTGVTWINTGLTWTAGNTVALKLTTTDPGAPGLTATPGPAKVTLSWTPPPTSGGSAITGYEYRQRTGDDYSAWTEIPNSASLTSYDVTGLTPGTAYTFQLRARNSGGAGLYSDEVTATATQAQTAQAQTEVWSATMTVGELTDQAGTGIGIFGYSASAGYGSLTDTDFTRGSTTYTVRAVANNQIAGSDVKLGITLDTALPASDVEGLVLHVGTSSFAFSDRNVFELVSGDVRYSWDSSLNLSVGDTVAVRLTLLDTTPPALESATVHVNGRAIGLLFDEVLDDSIFTFPISLVSVTADGSAVIVGEVSIRTDPSSLTHRLVEIGKLSPAIKYGQVVTVSYNDPTTSDDTTAVLEDAAGNDVASFTTGSGGVPAVVNNVPAPTQYIRGEIWSTTLTVKELSAGVSSGCRNAVTGKECSTLLDDDDFTYNGKTYQIVELQFAGDDLIIEFGIAPGDDVNSFELNADGRIYSFQNATMVTPEYFSIPPSGLCPVYRRHRGHAQYDRARRNDARPDDLEPGPQRARRRRQLPAAVHFDKRQRRQLLGHRRLQHLHSESGGYERPCRHPGPQRNLPDGRQHRSRRCPGQHRHDGHGRAHLLAERRQGGR